MITKPLDMTRILITPQLHRGQDKHGDVAAALVLRYYQRHHRCLFFVVSLSVIRGSCSQLQLVNESFQSVSVVREWKMSIGFAMSIFQKHDHCTCICYARRHHRANRVQFWRVGASS
jgi:hypothetical protein